MRRIAAVAIALLAPLAAARAQYNATLIVPRLPSPWVSDWERSGQSATLMVVYTGTAPTEYDVVAEIRGEARGLISTSSSGPYSIPIGPATQNISSTQLNCFASENLKSFTDQIVRTGQIPEDSYELTVKLLAHGTKTELARTSQLFTIALPDPPRLVFPQNGSSVLVGQPLFQWMPVSAPAELGVQYKVRVVEVLPLQTVDAALTSNRPVLEQLVSGSTTMLYPVDGLPLEDGSKYAWRVEAVDANGGPITSAHQRSEPWSFVRASVDAGLPTGFTVPDSIVLVPGVAVLTGIRDADTRDRSGSVMLYGRARLRLLGAVTGSTDVSLDGLAIDRSAFPEIVVNGGALSGRFDDGIAAARYVSLKSVSWTSTRGLRMRGELALPGMRAVPLAGDVELTASGPSGTLTSEAGASWPAIGTSVAKLRVRSARVSLPQGTVELSGSAGLFGSEDSCGDVAISPDSSGSLTASLSCSAQQSLSLVNGAAQPSLHVLRVDGTMYVDATGALSPSLTAVARLDLLSNGGCSAVAELAVAASISASRIVPSCAGEGALPMGWLRATLGNLRMEHLGFSAARGFDFALKVDAQLAVPGLAGLSLPTASDVTLTPVGWTFASASVPVAGTLAIGGVTFTAASAQLTGFTRAWTAADATGFTFTMPGTATLAAFSASPAPCVAAPLAITATVTGGRIALPIPEQALAAGCALPLGTGSLELTRLRGSVTAALPSLVAERGLEVQGAYVLPSMFSCGTTSRSMSLGASWLAVGGTGRVTGRATGVSTPCNIEMAAVTLGVTDATLDLDGGDDRVAVATLSGRATGSFSPSAQAINGSGLIGLDLIAGRMTSGSVSFAGPFALGMPRVAPAISLTVPGATLDTAGLHVDGRGSVAVTGAEPIGTTFDRLTINPATFSISGGRASFDQPFGLRAGIGTEGALAWSAVAAGASLDDAPSVRLDLGAGSWLGAEGLHSSGRAPASLRWQGVAVAAASASYSDSTVLRVAPFGVGAGSIDIQQQGERLAWIDATGFHPDRLLAAGALPRRLGLPSEEIAYIDLAGADTSAFHASRTPEGRLRLTTAQGKSLPVVFPSLGSSVRVQGVVDLTLDAGNVPRSGSVVAAPSSPLDLSASAVPFTVDTLRYALAMIGEWTVRGRPMPFGAALGSRGIAGATLGAAGLSASLSVPLATTIVMRPAQRPVSFVADSVRGFIEGARWQFDLPGRFEVALGSGRVLRNAATLSSTRAGVSAIGVGSGGADSLASVTLGALSLTLSNLRVGRLALVANAWDFALLFDARVGFAAMPGVTPIAVEELTLDREGMHVPAFSAPEISARAQPVRAYAIRPLAVRSAATVLQWYDGQGIADWPLRADLELSYPTVSALSAVRLSVLDARLQGSGFAGTIEPLTLQTPATIPIGTAGASLRITGLGGTLGATPNVTLTSELVMPAGQGCAAGASRSTALGSALSLNADAMVAGTVTNATLACSVVYGPVAIRFPSASIAISGSPRAGAALAATVTAAAAFTLPGVATPVLEARQMSLSLATLLPTTSVALSRVVKWPYTGATGSRAAFTANSIVIGPDGITLGGPGKLYLGADTLATVTSTGVRYSLPALAFVGNAVTVANSFALSAGVAANGVLSWRAPSAPGSAGDRLVMQVAAGATLAADGLHVASSTGNAITFDSRSFSSVALTASGDFRVGLEPVALASGRADLLSGADSLGYLAPAGFVPGSAFTRPALPLRLNLPSQEVAYVPLKDASGAPLVEVLRNGANATLRVLPGKSIELIVPGLASAGAAPPRFSVSLADVMVNPVTYAVVSGRIEVTLPTPVIQGGVFEVQKLVYSSEASAYALRANGRAVLPASLAGIAVPINGIEVTSAGPTGTRTLGRMATSFSASDSAIATGSAGQLGVAITGVRLTSTASDKRVELAGTLRTPVLTRAVGTASEQVPFFFTGTISAASSSFNVQSPAGVFNLGSSTYEPAAVGTAPAVSLAVTASSFALVTNGVWRVPALGRTFALGLANFAIGTGGVTLGGFGTGQAFDLFGARWSPRTAASGPSSSAAFANGVLSATLAGSVRLLGDTMPFSGLVIGSSGTVTAAQNLLASAVSLRDSTIRLTSLTVPSGKLTARVAVRLALPLRAAGAAPDEGNIVFGVDGAVEQSLIDLRVEQTGMRGTLVSVTGALVHPRRVSLRVPRADSASVQVIADAYFGSAEKDRIFIGNDVGGNVLPGYILPFKGRATWQNVRLQDTVITPIGTFAEIQVQGVTASPVDTFLLGLTGKFAISGTSRNVSPSENSTVTNARSGGGIIVSDVYLGVRGVDFSQAKFTGGSIALMNGAFVMQVNRVSFKNSPSSIMVAAPPPAPGTPPAAQALVSLAVARHLELGGSICIGKPGNTLTTGSIADCTFAGGIDRLLMYEDAATNKVSFTIQHAKVSVQNTISLDLNMRYDEVSGGGGLAFSGRGSLAAGKEVIAAGAVEVGTDDIRIGAFFSVPVQVQVGPVTLDQVGGGFFWNPRPEHLAIVRAAAFPSDQGATQVLSSEPARFAVFLYGGATIVTDRVAKGRALMTATDRQFRLDGSVQVLNQRNMTGRVQLVVGFARGYAEGTIDIVAVQPGLVKSTGNMSFFAYGADSWGVQGVSRTELFPKDLAMSTGASSVGAVFGGSTGMELFIGPRGMLVNFRIEKSVKLAKVIEVSGGITGRVWYHQPSSSWGAYGSVAVSASVLAGAVTASGRLEGALIGEGSSATLYCVGTLRASVLLIGSWSGSVWVAAGNNGLDGGLGRDASLDGALARAQQVSNEMESARREVTAALADVKAGSFTLALTDEQMLAAYGVLERSARQGGFSRVAILSAFEGLGYALATGTTTSYYTWYTDFLKASGRPAADSSVLRRLRTAAEADLASVQTLQSALEPKLSAIQATVSQANDAVLADSIADPTRSVSFAAPVATTEIAANGDTMRVLTSGPSFELDAAVVQAGVSTASAYEASMRALAARVLERAQAADASLTSVRAATSGSSESLMGVLTKYGTARASTEQLYATRLQNIGASLLWARNRSVALNAQKATVTSMLQTVVDRFSAGLATSTWSTNLAVQVVPGWTESRINTISDITGDASIKSAFATAKSGAFESGNKPKSDFWSTQFRATGMTLFFDIPDRATRAAIAALDTALANTRSEMAQKLGPIRAAQARLSGATEQIMQQQAELGGVTYDLYDRYLAMAPSGTDAGTATTRRTALLQGLKAPSMSSLTVAVSTTGWTSTTTASWSGTHPDGISEYVFQDGAGSGAYPLVSNGTSSSVSLTRSFLEDPAASLTQARTFYGSVRGGLGLRSQQAANYSLTYPEGVSAQQAGTTVDAGNATKSTTSTTTTSASSDRSPPSLSVHFETGSDDGSTAWMPASGRVKVLWTGTDPESGVSEYSIAVGTTRGGTDILPWTAMGARTERVLEGAVGADSVHVTIKAKNGAGLETTKYANALRRDGTPPTIAKLEAPIRPAAVSFNSSPSVSASCSANVMWGREQWGGNMRVVRVGPGAARAEFPVPAATDSQSGVRYYAVKIAPAADLTYDAAEEGWSGALIRDGKIIINNWRLNFRDSVVVSVAAVNYAGLASVTSYGPFIPYDDTPPSSPAFCAGVTSTAGLGVIVGSLSDDPESGVRGYQYRVRNALTDSVAKAFRADSVADFTLSTAGVITSVSSLGDGLWYVDLRAVNRQGLVGQYASSGPVMLDRSAPPSPSVSLTYRAPVALGRWESAGDGNARDSVFVVGFGSRNYEPGSVSATLTIRPDSQSGITSVEYGVVRTLNDTMSVQWNAVTGTGIGGGTRAQNIASRPSQPTTTTVDVTDLVSFEATRFATNARDAQRGSQQTTGSGGAGEWFLLVRATNGAGLTTAISYTRITAPETERRTRR